MQHDGDNDDTQVFAQQIRSLSPEEIAQVAGGGQDAAAANKSGIGKDWFAKFDE